MLTLEWIDGTPLSDIAALEKRGTDVTADRVDMEDRGAGLNELHALGTVEDPAEVISEGFTIKGPLLGMDQSTDFAWVTNF